VANATTLAARATNLIRFIIRNQATLGWLALRLTHLYACSEFFQKYFSAAACERVAK
jgi:hypothetical protein